MTTDTNPTPEENEAFEAIENASKRKPVPTFEPWLWLPAGEYTKAQLQQLLNSFDRMHEAQSGLGGGH